MGMNLCPLRKKNSLVLGEVTHSAARELVPELDEHLAALSILWHQYLKHAWLTSQPTVKKTMRRHQRKVYTDLDAFALGIISMGGVPLSGPLEQLNHSYLEHEDEGVFEERMMVELDLAHEQALHQRMSITLEVATDLGVPGPRRVLAAAEQGALRRRTRLLGLLDYL